MRPDPAPRPAPRRVPASIRNRNPGAMYPGPSARRFGTVGTEVLTSKDGVHKIATFEEHEQGAAALFHLLHQGSRNDRRLYCGKPIGAAIRTWCGGIHADAYLRVIEARAGVTRMDHLDDDFLRDPRRAIPLAKAMAWQEAGRDYPMTDRQWTESHAAFISTLPEPERSVPQIGPFAVEVHDAVPDPDLSEAVPEANDAERWTPENDLPSPKPETRAEHALRRSRKWSLVTLGKRVLAFFGFGTGTLMTADAAGTATSWIEAIKAFAADNAALLLILGIVIGYALFEVVQWLMREDAADGRYMSREE